MTNHNLPSPNNSPDLDKDLLDLLIHDQRVRAEITRRSHMWFFVTYFGHYMDYPFSSFHREMLTLSEDEENRMLAIMAFRGSGKSTMFSLSYPIWAILGKQNKKFVVVLAQTKEQAKQYLTNIRRELERNTLLRQDLGPFEEQDEEWNMGSIVIPKYDARITAISCEQNIRGRRHGNYRPDLIICDDLESQDSVRTREGRDKLYQWLTGDIIPSGDVNTRTIVIGNCLHNDGLMRRLESQIASGKRAGIFRRHPLLDESGQCLWPEKFTPEMIHDLKQIVADDAIWQREFLLRVVPDATQVIHEEWLTYYDDEKAETHGRNLRYTGIGVDMAISQNKSADYTAMVSACVYGRRENMRILIQSHPVNERLAFPDSHERLKTMVNMRRGETRIFVEDVGLQYALVQMLQKDGLYAEGVKVGMSDKRSRLALTTHLIKNGTIRFPRHGAEELIQQLVGFGMERNDDLADAFSVLIIKIMEHDKYSDLLGVGYVTTGGECNINFIETD